MNVDAAAESPSSALFQVRGDPKGIAHQKGLNLSVALHPVAVAALAVINHDTGYAPPESDAFYGPINVGGLKKERSSNNVPYKICALFCND